MTTKEAYNAEDSEETKKRYYTKNGCWLTKKALRCGYVDVQRKGSAIYKLHMSEIGYIVDFKNELTYSRNYFDTLTEARRSIKEA